LAASIFCSNALITLNTFPVTKFLAASISISLKLPAIKATVGKLQKLNSYNSDAMAFEAASNGESLNNLASANMSLSSTTGGEPPDAISNVSGNKLTENHGPIVCNDVDFDATSNGELPDEFNFFGQQDVPSNGKLTCFVPSLSNKIFPSIKDFSAGDLLALQLLGQQQVLLQDADHEQKIPLQDIFLEPVDLENSLFRRLFS